MIVISNVKDAQVELMDEVWFITNTNPNMPIGAYHHPELAPNKKLFIAYKQGGVTLCELLSSYDADLRKGVYKEPINRLLKLHEAGKWIQCCCYCPELDECHRWRFYQYLLEIGTENVTIL